MFYIRSPRNAEPSTPLAQLNQPTKHHLVHLLPNAELLNGEIFYTLKEAQVLIESWRHHYNPALQHPSVYAIEEKKFC